MSTSVASVFDKIASAVLEACAAESKQTRPCTSSMTKSGACIKECAVQAHGMACQCGPRQTLLSVGKPALEGHISFEPPAIPDLHCLVIAGRHEEQAIASQSKLVDTLAVLSQVGSKDPLRLPRGA